MRKLKFIAGTLVAIVAALGVAVYVALSQLDVESYRSTIESRVEAATGRKLSLAGDMQVSIGLTPSISAQDVRFANAGWSDRPQMAEVKRIDVELALLPLLIGDVQVNRLVLVEPALHLARNAEGAANWRFGEAAAAAPSDGGKPVIPGIETLRIENAQVTYTDAAAGIERRIDLARLTADRVAGDRLSLEAEGSHRDTALTLAGSLGAPRLLFRGPYPLDLTLTAAGAKLTLAGVITDPLGRAGPDLDVQAEGEQLARLGQLLGVALPQAGPFSLTASVNEENRVYIARGVSAEVGDSDLSGELTLDLGKARPDLTGDLKSAVLDLAALTGGAPAGDDSGASDEVFPPTPLPRDLLQSYLGNLELRIGTLKLRRGVTLEGVETTVRLADGRLSADPFSARLTGAPLTGRFALDAGQQPALLTLQLDADKVDYGRLLADAGVTDAVRGTLRLHAELRGAGNSPDAIARALAGELDISGTDGRIANSLLNTAGGGIAEVLAPWRERDADAKLNCVVGRFKIAKGVMTSQAILADTDTATLAGDGEIDLGTERYDLRLVPKAKQTSLMSLAVPMRLSGPLTDPSLGPDPAGAAKAGAIAIGSLVNPLATLGALVIESETNDANPCVSALRRAESGAAAGDDSGGSDGGGLGGFFEGLSKSIDETLGTTGKDANGAGNGGQGR